MLDDKFAACSCMEPVTHGYPCRHIFQAMKHRSNVFLPLRTINSRWLKDADVRSICIDVLTSQEVLTPQKEVKFLEDIQPILDKRDEQRQFHDLVCQLKSWGLREDRLLELIQTIEDATSHLMEKKPAEKKSETVRKLSNPAPVKMKGRPSKRRLKSSMETAKPSKKSKPSSANKESPPKKTGVGIITIGRINGDAPLLTCMLNHTAYSRAEIKESEVYKLV